MSAAARGQAAVTILRCRARGLKILELPARQQPPSLVDAYCLQAEVSRRTGSRRVGWKVACTSEQAQAAYPIAHPVAGPVHAHALLPCGAAVPGRRFASPAVEGEIVFGLSRGVPAKASRAALAAAVAWIAPGLEIVDSLFPDKRRAGVPSVVAGGHAAAVVMGPPMRDWRRLDLRRMAVRLHVDGHEAAAGTGAAVLGDPLEALAWLAEQLHAQGQRLEAGDCIFSGSCTGLTRIAAPCRISASFHGLGEVGTVLGPA